MKFCWFTTGADKEAFTLLKDVHKATEANAVDGEIALVFVNKDRSESPNSDDIIAFAEAKGIPLELMSSRKFLDEHSRRSDEGRALFDTLVKERIDKYGFDSIFLAGYMPILSPILFEHFRVFNLHPSLPGTYKGNRDNVIASTIKGGKRTFGAMVHRVDASLVGGQPLSFVKLVLEGRGFEELYNNVYRGDRTSFDHLFKFMREAQCAAEVPLVVQTLSSLSRGAIAIVDEKVYSGGEPTPSGVDMTDQVLTALRAKSDFSSEE